MSDQHTFADLAWTAKKKVTRRERFLAEMDAVMPWAQLTARIAPHYPNAARGRPALPLETMLRVYCLQHWFDLSDPAAEDALYDSEAMRRFARVTLTDEAIPDESTILRFRHLLEAHRLTEALFAEIQTLLTAKGLTVKSGTIVDATIINAPSSTKNATKTRDPEMRQTRKGNQWYFGMKIHVGADRQGLVHSLQVTNAATHDITQVIDLLHGDETVLHGDQAYSARWLKAVCEDVGIRYEVNHRAKVLTPEQKLANREKSRERARVEHSFHVVKRLWGFTKVRYRGLAKNRARAFAAFALANVYLVRRRLAPA